MLFPKECIPFFFQRKWSHVMYYGNFKHVFSLTPISYFKTLSLMYTLKWLFKHLKCCVFHSQFWPIWVGRDSAIWASWNHHCCLRSCVSGSTAQDLELDCLVQSQLGHFLAMLNCANVLISLYLLFLIEKMEVTVIFMLWGLNDVLIWNI